MVSPPLPTGSAVSTAITSAARHCEALSRAHRLATWVGDGRPVTPKHVLRPRDVPAAAQVLSIPAPARINTAADVRALHRPWKVALAIDLLRIVDGHAVAGPALEPWPDTDDTTVRELWLTGLVAAFAADAGNEDEAGATAFSRIMLGALSTDPPPSAVELWQRARETLTFEDAYVTDPFFTAAALAEALTTFVASGSKPTSSQVYQLKISLKRMRNPIWRRVLVPATARLGQLHEVIQIVMNWDGDHLHAFYVGNEHYGDPFNSPDLHDEESLRLSGAFTPSSKTITYLYDFGAGWYHDITYEKVLDLDVDATYPVCVTGRGDFPIEYWTDEDDHQEPIPFDQDKVNTRLAELARHSD